MSHPYLLAWIGDNIDNDDDTDDHDDNNNYNNNLTKIA